MRKIIKIIICIGFIAGTKNVISQQIPLGNLYNSNKYIINPAYAGGNECTQLYATHRQQWVGITNSPMTSYLSGSTYLGKNVGVGLKIYNDKTGILRQNYGLLSFAYHLKVAQSSKLSFGLSGGFFQNSIDQSAIIANDMTDEVFVGNDYKATFETDFGVSFSTDKLNVGISIPRFIETNTELKTPVDQGVFTLNRHGLGFVSYDIETSESVVFTPSVMTRWAPGVDFQYDINADINVSKSYSAGIGYREKAGFLARLGLIISEQFTVNYAYEFFQTGIASRSNGSHEIRIGLKLCKKTHQMPEKIKRADIKPVLNVKEENNVNSGNEQDINSKKKSEQKEEIILSKEELKIFKKSIQYGLNQSDALSKSTKTLTEVVGILEKHPMLKLELIGHTCDLGDAQINEKLSLERAAEVKAYFVSRGISKDRVRIKGFGERHPLAPNNSEHNRIKNRRVEFKIG